MVFVIGANKKLRSSFITYLRKMTKGGYRRKEDSWSYVLTSENLLQMSGIRTETAKEIRRAPSEKAQHLHDETTPVQQQQAEKTGSTHHVADIGTPQRVLPGRRPLRRGIRTKILRRLRS